MITKPGQAVDRVPEYTGRVRYTAEAAKQYVQRDGPAHRAEMRMIEKAFTHVPRGTVLDVPCGGGRVSLWLARNGYKVTAADLSLPMLDFARQNAARESLPITVEKGDIEHLAYPDRHFDAIVCFRLFHHFPNPSVRARAVAELCRVAGRHVLISYFTPYCGTSAKRMLQNKFFGKKIVKFATPLREVKLYFATHGFKLVENFARAPLLHTMNLAVFERQA